MPPRPTGENLATLYVDALDAVSTPVFIVDSDSVVVANAAARALLGAVDPAQVEGMAFEDLLHPDAWPAARQRLDIVLNSGRTLERVPSKVRSIDGRPIRVTVDVVPLHLASTALALYAFEVAGQERAIPPSPAYMDRGTLHENALERLPDPVLIHDRDSVVFANLAMREMLQASHAEQVEGRQFASFVHPDGFQAGAERRRLLFERGNALRGVPAKIVTVDGETIHVQGDAIPLTADDITAVVITAHLVAR